jgi:hypothetical protein
MKLHHLRAFFSLPSGERRLLLLALIGLPATAVLLRLFGFNRCYAGLRRLVRPRQLIEPAPNMLRAYRIAHLVRLANGRLPPAANCLQRSLVLWTLLRRHGVKSDLRIGVRKERPPAGNRASKSAAGSATRSRFRLPHRFEPQPRFQAHAWVEWQGVVLNDTPAVRQRYAAFDRPILPGRARLE